MDLMPTPDGAQGIIDMFKYLKEKFSKKPEPPKEKPKREPKKKQLTPKEEATLAGEPYINIISLEIDKDDPGQGAFELDWNDKFVANLVRAGYQGKTDADIVDNWFKAICRNVLLETFEQDQADLVNRKPSNKRDIGNGRSEIS